MGFSDKTLLLQIATNYFSFLSVLDHFYEGVMITDHKGRIIYYNQVQAKLDDLEPEHVIGRKVTDVYRVDDDGRSPTMQCLKMGKSVDNLACYYRTHLGKVVNSIHNVFPLYGDDRLVGAICFIRDYQAIEHTFEMVSKYSSGQPVQWFSKSPRESKGNHRLKNGTRFTFDDIVGENQAFLNTVNAARRASRTPSPVMLYGETGTGKELLAQSIHNHSYRNERPYVAINCAAIPETLLEGILFGTNRGAFTGAMDKPGLFEKANGGTLFLDEVNSMPLGLQAKLLRALQEKKIRRVGSVNETEIDLKIISSVNAEPRHAVTSGELRSDLMYRLGVVFIRIPPLRGRLDDMERLIAYFLYKSNKALSKNINSLSAKVLALFKNYHWPGNVRELEHVIEGAMNMAGDRETIETGHLSVHIGDLVTSGQDSKNNASDSDSAALNRSPKGRINIIFPAGPKPDRSVAENGNKGLMQVRADSEVETICSALIYSRGNGAMAARQLGISPQLLHYKMKKYQIDRKVFKP